MLYREISKISAIDLPIEDFTEYLQLSTDETGQVSQIALLETVLRSSIIEIEARLSRILLARVFEICVSKGQEVTIDIGKADNIIIVSAADAGMYSIAYEIDHLDVTIDLHRTRFRNKNASMGEIIINFRAGKENWSEIEADLQLAILTLAAYRYQSRFDDTRSQSGMERLVDCLLEKHRNLRIFKGAL